MMRKAASAAVILACMATSVSGELALVEPIRGAKCSWEAAGQKAAPAKRLGAGWVIQAGRTVCDTILHCSYTYLAAHRCTTNEQVFISTYFDVDLELWIKEDAPYPPDELIPRLKAKAQSSPQRVYVPGHGDVPAVLEREVKVSSGLNDGFIGFLSNYVGFEDWTWSQCACEIYYQGTSGASAQ